MEIEDVLSRGSRSVESGLGTKSAIEQMIRDVQATPIRPVQRRPSRRTLLFAVPLAVLLGLGLTAGGVSIVNSMTETADAIVEINYTAVDGSPVSCEVAVTAHSQAAKSWIHGHDWSDISAKLQEAGASPRSAVDVIDSEIPSNLWGDSRTDYVNFVTSC